MAKRKYSNWNPRRVERDAISWLASETNGPVAGSFFAQPTERIEAWIVTQDLNVIGSNVCGNLRRLSLWYVHVGELAIARGDASGWAELKRALRYQYWAIRSLVRLWELDTRRTKQERVIAQNAALSYALAITTQAHDEAHWLGERMRKGLEDGAFGKMDYECLAAFLLTLHLRSQGETDALVVPAVDGLEAYAGVFENWNDGKGLAEAIYNVAEYHLDHACDSDEHDIEFTMPPFIHVPVEVIALEKIRAGLGLETPRIEHELFSTVFCNPPEVIEDLEDPFLDKVVDVLKKVIAP